MNPFRDQWVIFKKPNVANFKQGTFEILEPRAEYISRSLEVEKLFQTSRIIVINCVTPGFIIHKSLCSENVDHFQIKFFVFEQIQYFLYSKDVWIEDILR